MQLRSDVRFWGRAACRNVPRGLAKAQGPDFSRVLYCTPAAGDAADDTATRCGVTRCTKKPRPVTWSGRPRRGIVARVGGAPLAMFRAGLCRRTRRPATGALHSATAPTLATPGQPGTSYPIRSRRARGRKPLFFQCSASCFGIPLSSRRPGASTARTDLRPVRRAPDGLGGPDGVGCTSRTVLPVGKSGRCRTGSGASPGQPRGATIGRSLRTATHDQESRHPARRLCCRGPAGRGGMPPDGATNVLRSLLPAADVSAPRPLDLRSGRGRKGW